MTNSNPEGENYHLLQDLQDVTQTKNSAQGEEVSPLYWAAIIHIISYNTCGIR